LKKTSVLFLIIMTFLLSYTLCAHAEDYDTVKVGLFYGDTAKTSVTVSVDTGISYGVFDGVSHIESGVLYGSDFKIEASSSSQLLLNGEHIIDTLESNLSILPLEGNIKIDSKEYRGGAMFTNASESTMNVINVVSMEEYLYGVIASEMPSSWNIEALKAQAVCARGFVVSNFNKHKSYGFNLCASTNCQVYSGVSAETESTNTAVDMTKGMVLTYDGNPIGSYFFSSSGGHTANVKNVWGSSFPYLCGVEDPFESEDSPRHTWSATLTKDEIADALKQSGEDIGSLIELSASSDETGRVYELKAIGTLGSHTLTRQNTYSPFYSKGVLSQKYTLTPVTEDGRTLYAISSNIKESLFSYTSLNSKGVKSDVSGGFSIISSKGTETYTQGTVNAYTFSGGGWGHGVGMSQYGAKGMADNGYTYDSILLHYFPGTELQSIN